MADPLEIVLVYLGKQRMPEYVYANLSYLKNTFPDREIVLLSDNIKTIESLKNEPIKTFLCYDYLDNSPQEYLDKIPDLQFRGGFWFYTIARFFAIEQYLKTRPDKPILHVESDVLLLKNFPFEKFDSEIGLAFPIVNLNYAAASTLFISNLAAASALCEFSREETYANPTITDMDILGSRFLSERVPLTYLPTAFGDMNHFQDWVPPIGRESLTTGLEKFQGIFDAMTWGQYLTGEDPRNNYGKKRIYGVQTHHSVAVDSYEIKYLNGEIIVSCECGSFPLYAIHVHSKDLQLFKQVEGQLLLRRRIAERKNGEFTENVWPMIMKFLPLKVKNMIKNRIRKLLYTQYNHDN